MIWLKCANHSISAIDVVLNLCLLNWFAKLPGVATYWFVTAIVIFYITVVVLSRLSRLRDWKWSTIGTLFVSAGILSAIFSLVGFRQGYVFMLLMLGAVMFLYGDEVCKFRTPNAKLQLLMGGGAFLIVWYLFHTGRLHVASSVGYWVSLPAVFLLSLGVLIGCDRCGRSKIIGGISAMSYEIYLVHSAMLGVAHAIAHDNVWMYAVVWTVITVVVSIALHWFSSQINDKLKVFLK